MSRRVAQALACSLALLACNSDRGTAPASCRGATVPELEGATISGQSIACTILDGAGQQFLLVPQYASGGIAPRATGFAIGTRLAASAGMAAPSLAGGGAAGTGPQRRLDGRLRALERAMQPDPVALARARAAASLSVAAGAAAVDEFRTFRVLADLAGTTFKTSGARLRYSGDHIAIYVDTLAPSGFSDAELQELGALFDDVLYQIAVNAFGPASDLDENQRVVILLTQLINELTDANECSTEGFVTGYFFGFDLADGQSPNSNKGEVFYALVPDEGAVHSCRHSVDAVKRIIPGTFIHEFQHMISYNQHVLQRGGRSEEAWLNEGLSHIAEELASKYYEAKFPPPFGRTNPAQLFPDSSQGFIVPQLDNSYKYLRNSNRLNHSVVAFRDFGTLEERGAAWLFLRWLGDLEGEEVFRRLVQTNRTGMANVEQVTGEPFPGLFGDFSIALYTDSLPGIPRDAIPERNRFQTRNLRQLYARLHAADPTEYPLEFPIEPRALDCDASAQASMVQATMDFYVLETAGCASAAVRFRESDLSAFPTTLRAQLGVFNLTPAP